MEAAVKSLTSNLTVILIAAVAVALTGVFHLAVGAAYAAVDVPFATTTLASLLASPQGVKATAAYLIVNGIFLLGAPAFVYWNLAKNTSSRILAFVGWATACLLLVATFSCAVLTAQIYTPAANYARLNGLSLTDYATKISSMYRFALADSIITFLLAWPSTVLLTASTNLHREKVDQGDSSQPSEKLHQQQSPIPGQVQAFPGSPRSIDLGRQPELPEGEAERHIGNFNSKEMGFDRQELPHFSQLEEAALQLGAREVRRSKTQFVYSEPQFHMQPYARNPFRDDRSQSGRSQH